MKLKYTTFVKNTIKQFDLILLNNEFYGRHYISNLFYVRNHPNFLIDLKSLYQRKINLKLIAVISLFCAKRLVSISYSFKLFFSHKKLSKHYDYMIFSHLIDENIYCYSNDFYYGNLLTRLSNDYNKKICIVFFNQTKLNSIKILKKVPLSENIDFVVLNRRTNLILDFMNIIKSIKILISFIKLRKIFNYDFIFLKFIFYSLFKEESFNNLRIDNQIKKLSQIYVKNFILTYEGHSYERTIINSIYKYSNKSQILAYQHSGSFSSQHSIYRSYGKFFDPNIFLFSGKVGQQLFLKNNNFVKKSFRYCLLGSNRHTLNKNIKKLDPHTIVIMPDGTNSEINLLFNLTLMLSKKNKNKIFIFKLHPNSIISYNKFKNYINKNLLINIDPIKSFFQNYSPKFIVFRGSTAVIQAISQNIIPLYYDVDLNADDNLNPLYMIWSKKFTFHNLESFNHIISDKNIKINKNLIKYTNEYFVKYNLSNLIKISKK